MRHLWLFLTFAILAICGCSDSPESSNGEPMLVVPQVSVGKIRHGMTVNELTAVLGEPSLRTKNSLVYSRLGLAVMPDPAGRIQLVLCGDVMGLEGPFTKAFKGKTKEGIAMLSTREEVIKAFGEPSSIGTFSPGIPTLKYQSLGMDISLEKDRVFHMIVRLTGTVEGSASSMTIDLGEPAKTN